MSRPLCTIWVCIDCICLAANGEFNPERPEDLPAPLSAIGEGRSVTAGMAREEHDPECEPEDDCDCERHTFSWERCQGCDDTHAGDRFAMTLWLDAHIVRERRYGPEGTIRRAVCSCGDESFPIKDGWTLAEVAAGHAVDGVLLPSPSWGHAESV